VSIRAHGDRPGLHVALDFHAEDNVDGAAVVQKQLDLKLGWGARQVVLGR
jgi:hypothetical protein